MNWTKDRSIVLSQFCVGAFALLLLTIDILGYWLVGFFIQLRNMNWQLGAVILAAVYLCSVFAWIVLWRLWKLLGNIKAGRVFIPENISHMRTVSWCCAAVALACLLAGLAYLPFFICAMASAFMALIVRIVKNAFQQARLMKDELDFTV